MIERTLSGTIIHLVSKEHRSDGSTTDVEVIRRFEPEMYPYFLLLVSAEEACSFVRRDLEMKIKSPELWEIQLNACRESLEEAAKTLLEKLSEKGYNTKGISV